MLTEELLSLRDAAAMLDLATPRVYRLGRYLHMAPGDQCLPLDVIAQARAEPDPETRYRIVLEWLLTHLQPVGASDTEQAGNGR